MLFSLHFARNLLNLLEFLAEAFRCHVHHFQCLTDRQVSLTSFLQSEVKITHIIVQNNTYLDNLLQNVSSFKVSLKIALIVNIRIILPFYKR